MKLPDLDAVRSVFGYLRSYLPNKPDDGPIESCPALHKFLMTRSAYIAQTSLYGYLKTRMGTRYTELFQDDNFVVSINLAKWQVCAACLSDLTVFAVGHCVIHGELDDVAAQQFARTTFQAALNELFCEADAIAVRDAAIPVFDSRISVTDWQTIGEGEHAFSESPDQLVACAPVSDDFKARDREIIINSIRFRWREVREHFRKRAEVEAIVADWQANDRS